MPRGCPQRFERGPRAPRRCGQAGVGWAQGGGQRPGGRAWRGRGDPIFCRKCPRGWIWGCRTSDEARARSRLTAVSGSISSPQWTAGRPPSWGATSSSPIVGGAQTPLLAETLLAPKPASQPKITEDLVAVFFLNSPETHQSKRQYQLTVLSVADGRLRPAVAATPGSPPRDHPPRAAGEGAARPPPFAARATLARRSAYEATRRLTDADSDHRPPVGSLRGRHRRSARSDPRGGWIIGRRRLSRPPVGVSPSQQPMRRAHEARRTVADRMGLP